MYFDETNNFFDISSSDYMIDKYTDKSKIINTNMDFDIENIVFNRNSNTVNAIEGFNRGNMFNNLYIPYKNHVYKLKVKSSKDDLLYKIQSLNFAIKDINLYLDINPNDKEMLNKYHKYNNELKVLKEKFEKEYSPICINDVASENKWTWVNNPWPWDKGDNLNV